MITTLKNALFFLHYFKSVCIKPICLKSFVLLLTTLLASACAIRTHKLPDIEKHLNNVDPVETVVILHGMWRNAEAMQPAAEFLKELKYNVINLTYPSTEFPIEDLAMKFLHPELIKLRAKKHSKIHFVTHSMGGILVRYYLKHKQISNLGNVVMISPPNKGTELTKLAENAKWLKLDTGPAGKQLSADKSSWVNQLGNVNFKLGVIAGNYNTNWITSWILPGDDDGVVPVANTKINGMSDFLLVSEKHFRIRKSEPVLQQTAYFLQNGTFLHE